MGEHRVLESWKAIVDYLGHDVKTCRRWEKELGLPVHRLDDSAKARVFAYTDELDTWKEEKLGPHKFQLIRSRPKTARKARIWLMAGVALVVLAVAAVILIRHSRFAGIPSGSHAAKSVAVLPFADLSPDKDQEHIADGISDILINTLERFEGLRIPARTSAFYFKGKDVTPAEIGRRLKVEWILEGSVQVYENRLRVAANLLRAADGTTIWADRYDKDRFDIFTVEDEIARMVADNLKVKIIREERAPVVRRGTRDIEAYNQFLKGRRFTERGRAFFKQAIECYEKAVERDPRYAEAYAQMSNCHYSLGSVGAMPQGEACPKAREAALKALAIDGQNPDALGTMASIKLSYDWNFPGAEEDIRKAIGIHPADARLHDIHAALLSALGRHDEAIREARLAVERDPLSTACWNNLAMCGYYPSRRFDLAL
jgi:TolB-like protein